MLENDESIKYIEEWTSNHEAQVQKNDAPIEDIQNRTKELEEK